MFVWQIGGEVSKLRVFFGDCDDALFVDDLAGRARVIAASITPYAKVCASRSMGPRRNAKHVLI